MATKTLKFVTTVLKSMNKTEKDVQTEKVTAFVEDSTIECQQQISTLETSVLPGLRLKLKREQNNLDKTEEHIQDETNVKRNLRNLIEKGMDLADDMIETVRISESPKAFEPASIFLKTLVELNESKLQYTQSKSNLISTYYSYLSSKANVDYVIGVIY